MKQYPGGVIWLGLAAICGMNLMAWGQASSPARAARHESMPPRLQRGFVLATHGHCLKAKPLLSMAAISRLRDPQLFYNAAMAVAQCGMELDDMRLSDQALILLNQRLPHDPKVLYITSHYYSEMANRSAHKLLHDEPNSPEAQEMLAEALEARGNWSQAADAYRKILAAHPKEPGVHYQLGRIVLRKHLTPALAAEARHEFNAELKIDPSPAADFMLGDLDSRSHRLPQAIAHFRRAVREDAGFTEAYLGLGMALNAARQYHAAITPLRQYVALDGLNPAGHYQLAIAYARSGNTTRAKQEMALLRKLSALAHPVASGEDMAQPH